MNAGDPSRRPEPATDFFRNLKAEPWRFDFFVLLRHLERKFRDKPRIGDAATSREEVARFGQNPFMEFPASNVVRADQDEDKPLKIFVRHLGMLGPQGPLPLAITEEAYHYALAEDEAFPRFLDLFNHRFIQLFFRAWADSRPIAQHDRPDADRFAAYIGSAIGIGSRPYHNLDTLPDGAKLSFAGLLGAQAKSASRLAAAIRGIFGVKAEVDEFVGSRLVFDTAEWTIVGRGYNVLGEDALLGRSVFSVQDKIRVRVFSENLAQYIRFLPTGDLCEPLADLVFFYNGEQLDYDVELAIPAGAAAPVRLGSFGQLGWTSWMAPNWTSKEAYRQDARFHPAERMRRKRKQLQNRFEKEGRRDGGH
jgi:type VI secretion system protein ImpH